MNETEKEMKIYEAGFHIVPNLVEDEVRAQYDEVKRMITDGGGAIISEGEPTLRTFAYAISKTVKAVKSTYSKAYFAWIKFEIASEDVGNIKKNLDEMPTIIRHLIVLTVRENTLIGKPDAVLEDEDASEADNSDSGEEKEVKEVAPETLEDLDKTIDDLVVQ